MAWKEKLGATRYRAGWRDGNGRRRYASKDDTGQRFTTAKAALAYAVVAEGSALGDSATDRKATFGYWLDQWLTIRNVEASTDKRDRERIDKHVRPQWESMPVRRITKLACEQWVSELDDVLSAWTVRRIWFNFATPLRWAHERGARLTNPLPYTLSRGTLPTPGPGHERYLARDLLPALEGELDGASLVAVQLLFGTGIRFSELAGLHRSRVDLERQTLHVVETWDRDGNQIKGYPKSKLARDVPLPDWLCGSLEGWFSTPGRPDCGKAHDAGTLCQSGLVVTGVKGGPLNREHFADGVYKPALEAIGAPPLRIHDARHTYASWLIQAGRTIEEVSQLLGHHSIVVTQKYAHLGGAHWAGVREALARGSQPPAPPRQGQKRDNGNQSERVITRGNLTLVS